MADVSLDHFIDAQNTNFAVAMAVLSRAVNSTSSFSLKTFQLSAY